MRIEFDIHTHSIASGHGSSDTIYHMALQACRRGLKLLGISDHGPQTPGSCKSSYFRNLMYAPSKRCNIELLYGVELNILDSQGHVDLDDQTLSMMDYAIASLHTQNIQPQNRSANTNACIHAMENPTVCILGHPDDEKFPIDYTQLVKAAVKNHTALEINERSLSPDGYRGNTRSRYIEMLALCKQYSCPVVLGSDSHGGTGIGRFYYASLLLKYLGFPDELVLNYSITSLKSMFLQNRSI